MSPQNDPELEDSNPIFLHDTLAHDDVLPYQVSYRPVEYSLEFWTFPVSLTLTKTEQIKSLHKTTQLIMMGH